MELDRGVSDCSGRSPGVWTPIAPPDPDRDGLGKDCRNVGRAAVKS